MTATYDGPGPEERFKTYLREGRLMFLRERTTGRFIFYPRVLDPDTGSTALDWVEVSGKGTVYSTTVNRARPPAKDRNIVLVDLDEGVRLMSRVENIEPHKVTIGMRVKARIVLEDDEPMIVFTPLVGEEPA